MRGLSPPTGATVSSPTHSPAWQALEAHRDKVAALRVDDQFAADPGRGAAFTFACGPLRIDLSKQRMTRETLAGLVAFARERDVTGAIERLFTGKRVNVTEDRPALHAAMRGDEKVVVDGEDVLPQVQRCRERMRSFSTAVREGAWKGATGGPIRHVLSLGIGGSYLGPRLVAEALRAPQTKTKRRHAAIDWLSSPAWVLNNLSKPKIFAVSMEPPRMPGSGGEVRTYFFIRMLAQFGDLTLVSLGGPGGDRKVNDDISRLCQQVIEPQNGWQDDNRRAQPTSRLRSWRKLIGIADALA